MCKLTSEQERFMTFGELVKEMRLKKNVSLRKLAEEIGVAAPYLSDVEKGRRNPLSEEKMRKVIEVLGLTPEEANELFDHAALERKGTVAPDISSYVSDHESVRAALRKAKSMNLGDDDWLRIIEEMEKEKGGQ